MSTWAIVATEFDEKHDYSNLSTVYQSTVYQHGHSQAEQRADAAKHAQWAAEAEQAKVMQAQAQREKAQAEQEQRKVQIAEDEHARKNLDLDRPIYLKAGAFVCVNESALGAGTGHEKAYSEFPSGVCFLAGGGHRVRIVPEGSTWLSTLPGHTEILMLGQERAGVTRSVGTGWVRHSSLTNTDQQPAPSHHR